MKAFCATKKILKSRQALHEIFFNPQCKCAEVPQSPISRSMPPFSVALFFGISQPLAQDQKNGKETYCWFPPCFFSINLKAVLSHISLDPSVFHLSPEHLLNFLSNLYAPPWFEENFKFIVFRLLENAFASQKIKSSHFKNFFYSCVLGKTFPQVFINNNTQAEGNYSESWKSEQN